MKPDPEEIADLVRDVVARTLGSDKITGYVHRMIIGEESVRAMPLGSTQVVPAGAILTPLAQQIALERKINFTRSSEAVVGAAANSLSIQSNASSLITPSDASSKAVAVGADHGGFELKEKIKSWLDEGGFPVVDCGTHSKEAVDYPDYAFSVAQTVAGGQAFRGIIVDGAGIGSCMAANKVPGVRAAMCYDQATAVNSREHNNANVLTLGAGLIGPSLAKQIVNTWLVTDFGGGRHARRVDKIDDIGRRFSK